MYILEFKTRMISVGFSCIQNIFFFLLSSILFSHFDFSFCLQTNYMQSITFIFDCKSTVVAFIRFHSSLSLFLYLSSFYTSAPAFAIMVFIVDFNSNIYARYVPILYGCRVLSESLFGWLIIYGCTTNISLHSFRVAFDYSVFFVWVCWGLNGAVAAVALALLWNMNCNVQI